jgi:hypothetical protein
MEPDAGFTTLTGVNRCTVRRDILRDLGDLLLLTATKDGDENTFIDEVNLNAEVGAYIGREAYFCGVDVPTANDGLTRYVVDSSRFQHALAFSVPLLGPTVAGDECELVNLRGVGYHAHTVNEAINESIRFAQRHQLFGLSSATIAPDTSTGLYPLPPEFRTVEHVYYTDSLGNAQELTKVKSRGNPGFIVDRANRSLLITFPLQYASSAQTLRIDGLTEPAELTDDASMTRVDAEWLVFQTEASLARGRFLRSPSPESQAVMGTLMQQSNALREQLATRRSPWSVDLS